MTENPYYRGPVSDHFDGTRFFNPGQPPTDRTLNQLLRWRLSARTSAWPRSVPITPAVPDARVAGLRVTMVGHATVLIQAAGINILTDPVWSDRASPLRRIGPRRVTQPGIAFDALPPIDAVLLSHNHYDHLDIDTLGRLHAAHRPLIVTPLGNDAIVRRAVPGARLAVGDWGDCVDLGGSVVGGSVETVLVPAHHWSSRGVRDRRMALWCGFMVRTPAGLVYVAGDTGYGDGGIFREMAARYGAPDLALLPIGAYEPRWFMAAQHVNPAEAVGILLDTGAVRALGTHWGTFQLTDEAQDAPATALREALAARQVDPANFLAAAPGQAFDVPVR